MPAGPLDELKKLQQFVKEGAAISAANEALVASCAFLEMWEQLHHPIPFRPTESTLQLAGRTLTLEDPPPTIWLEWDQPHTCVRLVAEGALQTQHYGLRFAGGKLHLERPRRRKRADQQASFGEILELMYELIRQHRAQYPTRNAADMTRRECRTMLAEPLLAENTAHAREALLRLDATAFSELLTKAIEDMAMDELSNQLTLALDGNYAQELPSGQVLHGSSKPNDAAPLPIPQERTPWGIRRELLFLQIAVELMAHAEQDLELALGPATLLAETDTPHTLTLRVPISGSHSIPEGTRLTVLTKQHPTPIGWFTTHICENDHLVGKLIWLSQTDLDRDLDGLYARPPRSPGLFTAAELGHLAEEIDTHQIPHQHALGVMLGLASPPPLEASLPDHDNLPAHVAHRHSSQQRAWHAATQDNNPVVLIQGPPGTGKTSVLEDTILTLISEGRRVLLAAPSNTAVDNAARRLHDQPLLRTGRNVHTIASDQASRWCGDPEVLQAFLDTHTEGGCVIAGTPLGLLRDNTVNTMAQDRPFDAIVFDEAGMAPLAEVLLCSRLAQRAILFGDHQQLPPFPIAPTVKTQLQRVRGAISRSMETALERSALEWLSEARHFPVLLLQHSFRCQNPRLMRFASTLFYNAQVRASTDAEYFSLPYAARQKKYPPSSLSLLCTSALPVESRTEKIVVTGNRPGIENRTEATIIAQLFYQWLRDVPLNEIAIITPYRRQARRIRRALSRRRAEQISGTQLSDTRWQEYLQERISTVDSFQGDESDVVLISYVRSNARGSVGFSDDPNRINVAHTRCRRAMAVVADLECLKAGASTPIFERMERAFARDGEKVMVTPDQLATWLEQAEPPPHQIDLPLNAATNHESSTR
jgi:hypothetical protein